MCLPQSMMTEWYWTGSLSAWSRFCSLRLKPDAQYETALLAGQCDDIVQRLFPVSWAALAGWPQSAEAAA
jgi:thymidylate synthase (FAD)